MLKNKLIDAKLLFINELDCFIICTTLIMTVQLEGISILVLYAKQKHPGCKKVQD